MEVGPLLDRLSLFFSTRPPARIELGSLKPAAVALPLTIAEGKLCILFTVRTDTVEHHKNEISFPGGRVDEEDVDELAAALRETWEEIGIPSTELGVVGEMDDFVSISGYRVRPFVVFIRETRPAFDPYPGEVSEILEVPVGHLLDPSNHHVEATPLSQGKPIHFFNWRDRVIWGLTGAILRQFLDLAFDLGGDGNDGGC